MERKTTENSYRHRRKISPPDIPGADLGWTSDDLFFLKGLPKKIIIVGGGYIAVEFAGIFHGLGVEVTEINRGNRFAEKSLMPR